MLTNEGVLDVFSNIFTAHLTFQVFCYPKAGFNEFLILIVLLLYSLLGQTYKQKDFDVLFYSAIAFLLFNNLRLTWFFTFTDKAEIEASGPVKDAWAIMRFKRSWLSACTHLIQYLLLISVAATRYCQCDKTKIIQL